ncbi:MAG: hypothetical protein ACUZ8H_09560 [Candidatus Anammoxibacter sp.]
MSKIKESALANHCMSFKAVFGVPDHSGHGLFYAMLQKKKKKINIENEPGMVDFKEKVQSGELDKSQTVDELNKLVELAKKRSKKVKTK